MWFFYSPNIIYGEDALNFLENITGEKCFIITDKVLEELGYLKILTDKLDKLGKQYKIFTEVKPDPHSEDVLKARDLCISYAPDLILALGGGSVMDTAKVVWELYEFPDTTLDDIHPFRRDLYDMGKKSKLVAIPTTSGTGSETTNVSVVSKFDNNIWKKYLYIHKGLVPTYAIVDPIFPEGMPPKLTVNTAFDALSHAIEGIASLWKNDVSDALALKAIEFIFKYLPIAYKDGKNKEARDKMHLAGTIAGLAFGNSQVHIGHTMAHSWGGIFHTPHGEGCGIMLNYATQYILNDPAGADETIDIYAKLAKQLGWAKWDVDNKQAAYSVIDKIKELQKTCNASTTLKDTGVSREDLDKNLDALVSLCFEDASSVLAPRSAGAPDLKSLYTYAYEGKDVDF